MFVLPRPLALKIKILSAAIVLYIPSRDHGRQDPILGRRVLLNRSVM